MKNPAVFEKRKKEKRALTPQLTLGLSPSVHKHSNYEILMSQHAKCCCTVALSLAVQDKISIKRDKASLLADKHSVTRESSSTRGSCWVV